MQKCRCRECNTRLEQHQEIAIIIPTVARHKFCSEECVSRYNLRMQSLYRENDIVRDLLKASAMSTRQDFMLELDEIREELERESEIIYEEKLSRARALMQSELRDSQEDSYKAGYFDGYANAVKAPKVCERCHKHVVESVHHLVPREYGGSDNIENFALLCFVCHDYVEIETDKLFKLGRVYDSDTLRSFVCAEFPSLPISARKSERDDREEQHFILEDTNRL